MNNKATTYKSNTDTISNIQPGNRISWLDILRGIGILLMVYGHINYNVSVYTWIYSFHMPLFFFAAGIVYKEHPVIKDILHRAFTILIPYFFYGIITLLFWQFAERHYKPSDLSFTAAAKGLLIGNEDALDFNIPLWFLPCFFLTLVLYNIVRRLVTACTHSTAKCSQKQLASFLVCIGLSTIYCLDMLPVLPWGIDRIPKYILFVALGEIAANLLANPNNSKNGQMMNVTATSIKKRLLALLCAILLLTASISLSGKLPYTVIRYQWFLVAMLGCAFVVALSIAISHCHLLEICGQSALLILCIHGPVYRALIYNLTQIADKTVEWLRTTPAVITGLTLATILICILLRLLMLLPLRINQRKRKK